MYLLRYQRFLMLQDVNLPKFLQSDYIYLNTIP
nr:MAG TPA: hypothetical protein [Caudoviricetes sp.]